MDDEDDPVVKEIDVYLSQRLADHLYLFQYPVRPAHMTYDQSHHLNARIKPTQQRVELELAIDTNSPNYARSKGEQIAINVDGDIPKTFLDGVMDKQVLSSVPIGLNASKYVLGNYINGELHVTPFKGIIQLRPSFGFIDEADSKNEKETAETEIEDDEPKEVTVRYARRETDEVKARRIASFEYVNKRREEEQWVSLNYHQVDEHAAEDERRRLLTQDIKPSAEFHMLPGQFLAKLVPNDAVEEHKAPPLPSNVLSLAELKSQSIGDQIKALMINAKVLKFSQLLHLLPQGTDQTVALRSLQQVAMFIQGCWVVKSEVLYPKDTSSANSGVPADMLCRGRDYVMWRFTQARFVVRKDISSVIKLPAEDVKDILDQMARLRISKGWEFLCDLDVGFISQHPEVVQRQAMLWDAKFTQLCAMLKLSKADLERKSKSQEVMEEQLASPKRRQRSGSGRSRTLSKSGGLSDYSDDDGIKQERCRKLSGSSHVAEIKIKKEKLDKVTLETAVTLDRSPDLSEKLVNPLVVPVNNDFPAMGVKGETPMEAEPPCIPATYSANGEQLSLGGDLRSELLKFVREKLISRFVLTLTEVKGLLALKLAQCPPGHVLCTGITDQLLETAMLEAGGVLAGPFSDEPVYVLSRTGDRSDPIRQCLVEIVKEKRSFQSALLKKKMEERDIALPSDAEFKRILREYCSTRGSQWFLKTYKEF